MDTETTYQGAAHLCVLFADITGSTRLYEALGDEEASRMVRLCLEEMKAATLHHQGRVVETIGDEILSTFAMPAQAALAAEDMMRRVEKLPSPGGRPLSLRIGFHFGPVLQDGGKIFGDTVNTAARICSLAGARQIFTSKHAAVLLPPLLSSAIREIAAFSLKGKREDMDVCELLWRGEHSELTVQFRGVLNASQNRRLLLRLNAERMHVVDADSGALSLGREVDNHIIVDNRRVSRRHARIELRRDKFVLTDTSTNGTWVLFEGQGEVVLRHEELALRGRGFISLGHPYDPSDTVGTLEFEET
jgi:class 3 adenylate cyclase